MSVIYGANIAVISLWLNFGANFRDQGRFTVVQHRIAALEVPGKVSLPSARAPSVAGSLANIQRTAAASTWLQPYRLSRYRGVQHPVNSAQPVADARR